MLGMLAPAKQPGESVETKSDFPPVVSLAVHLENGQRIIFPEEDVVRDVPSVIFRFDLFSQTKFR